jgi:hypothetical protein
MLTSLTRLKRLRAGWIVALIYLLCVLAPTLSFALSGSRAVSPCLTEAAIAHTHMETPIQHVGVGGHMHDHANVHSHASSGDFDRSMSMAINAKSVNAKSVNAEPVNAKSVPEKAPHSSDGQCCGLMCITALPAKLINIGKPSPPVALCEVEGHGKVTDNAPPRHYRPPIS